MLTRKDIIKENRELYKTAFHLILKKFVKLVYCKESDNYHIYDSYGDYLGRCHPMNLTEFQL